MVVPNFVSLFYKKNGSVIITTLFTLMLIQLSYFGSSISINQIDTTPPKIIATTPSQGETAVEIGIINIGVVFSEEMNTSTYEIGTFNHFSVRDSGGNTIAAQSWAPGADSLGISPAVPLKENETYTIIVNATVTDLEGNMLDGNGNGVAEGSPTDDFVSTFTTQILPPDFFNPTVISVSPSPGEVNVSTGIVEIKIAFSEEMNRSRYFESNAIYLQDSGYNVLNVQAVSPGKDSFGIIPASPLEDDEVYTVIVNATVTDLSGNTLDGNNNGVAEGSPLDDFSARFSTGSIFILDDTDNDSLSDSDEIYIYFTDPLKVDTDDDDLSDYLEIFNYYTDPSNNDSDNDGLDDGVEIYTYESDPLNPDTEDDGMPDGWEVDNQLNLNIDDASEDPDSDGFTNLEEFKNGTDPHDFNSTPTSDTDTSGTDTSGTDTSGTDTSGTDTSGSSKSTIDLLRFNWTWFILPFISVFSFKYQNRKAKS
ncbi:MAG: hypothetical protein GPJ54_20825 [Candidatus Heimdallarchaeota archaeon]|nr:hypothetical protein [Candidatus Heimdallarchaeota archaeon]